MRAKKEIICIGSAVVLLLSYLVVRYPLLYLHNMKEWPLDLLIFSLIIEIIVFFWKNILVSISLPVGYILGFILGNLFHEMVPHGPEMSNNFWWIWTETLVIVAGAAILVSLIISLVRKMAIARTEKA